MTYGNAQKIKYMCINSNAPATVRMAELFEDESKHSFALRILLKNTCDRKLVAVGIRIYLYDIDHNQVGETVKTWYKNIFIVPNKIFGLNNFIPLTVKPDSIEIEIAAVKYNDGEIWKHDEIKAVSAIKEEKPDNIVKPVEMVSEEKPEIQSIETISKKEPRKLGKKGKIVIAAIAAVMLLGIGAFVCVKTVIPTVRYNSAVSMMENGQYDEASEAFHQLSGFKDSADMIHECQQRKQMDAYQDGIALMDAGNYMEAMAVFEELNGFNDSDKMVEKCEELTTADRYDEALQLEKEGQWQQALEMFEKLKDYNDSENQAVECKYQLACQELNNGNNEAAIEQFEALGNYSDSEDQIKEAYYRQATALYDKKDFDASNKIFKSLGNYKDSKNKIHDHKYAESITKEPTCTEEGEKTYTCSCGKTYTEKVAALGHSYSTTNVVKEASCTEPGKVLHVCRCGDTKEETIPTTGHTYSSAVTKQASCQEAGVVTYTCHCGDSYTESIPKTGHVYTEGSCWDAPECMFCGYSTGKELGHTTKKGKCSRCGLYIRDGEEWDSYEDWYDSKYDY